MHVSVKWLKGPNSTHPEGFELFTAAQPNHATQNIKGMMATKIRSKKWYGMQILSPCFLWIIWNLFSVFTKKSQKSEHPTGPPFHHLYFALVIPMGEKWWTSGTSLLPPIAVAHGFGKVTILQSHLSSWLVCQQVGLKWISRNKKASIDQPLYWFWKNPQFKIYGWIFKNKKQNTSCDPHHDISRYILGQFIWHIFWHSIWNIFWHPIWHIFWHSI